MGLLVRRVNLANWASEEGVLSPDVLKDFEPKKTTLSVFRIQFPDTSEELNRLATALGCMTSKVGDFGCVLFPEESIANNFELITSAGNTPDDEVNNWHRDLVVPTLDRLFQLLAIISEEYETRVIHRNQVFKLIVTAISDGRINLRKSLVEDVKDLRSVIDHLVRARRDEET